MGFPTFPASGVQNALTPASTSKAPSVDATVAGLALKQALLVSGTNIKTINGSSILGSGDIVIVGGGGGAVDSVFGRIGTVVAATNDYTFAQIGSKPTTLSGYGIADAAPLAHVGAGGGVHADVVEGGASGFITGVMAAKVAGIASGATANSSDATLFARANHTGTQTASTIQDFNEALLDYLGQQSTPGQGLIAGANITLTYNDAANTLSISSAITGGATLANGDYGDVTVTSAGAVITIDPGVVTLAKMANLPTDTLMGRDTAGTGVPEQLTVTGGIEFTGTGGIQTGAFTGDVTKSAGGTALAIAVSSVTYAKMQTIGTDTLIGRDTAATGAPEAITVGGGLEFTGTGGIQTSALTGAVTKTAGGTVTTLASSIVALANMANLAQDQFIGRITVGAAGVPETATITAAARTVLDDISVDAMLNTLGGATATGTGAVVRANTPTLVTPILGVATASSIAVGGGTALVTTNRTGAGNLVLDSDATLVRPVFSGITTGDGANVTTPNAMAALAIDVAKGLNTKSIAVDSTFTFSGTPATANTWFGMLVTNTDTLPHILTVPSSFDFGAQATRTTTPIAANGRLYLIWHYNGSAYNLFGGSGFLNKYDATVAPTANEDVADGYGPGSLWLNATSNIAYICESNGAAAAVWNILGGGVSDADYGDVTVAAGVWTIDAGVVTLAKMASIATDKLIGRDTTGTGVPEAIGVSGGIEFDGTGNIRTTAFTGDVTKAAAGTALTIANGVVTLAKMADIATASFIGRVTAATGVPEALTATQATSLLNTFGALKGLVPANGGATTTFLRADGVFASPAGAGTVTNTGNLTLNSLVLGNAITDSKVVAGIVSDGVSKVTLGVAGVSVGGLLMANATSGTVELRPVAGALGTGVITVPAATDTMVLLAATQTLTNKTLTSPTLTAPALGVATATSINGNTITTGTATLTGAAGKTLTWSNSITLAGTDATTMTFPAVSASIGYLDMPQNSQSAAYTFVLADNGKHVLHPSADVTARTFTIDANATVAFPIGAKLCVVNQNAAGVVTIAITTDTMRLAGAGTTGSRTLAANGIAVAIKLTATEWIVDGIGLT